MMTTATASVIIGDSNREKDPYVSSQNVGSVIKIDSIYIDLQDDVHAKSYKETCNHFSIREYVSDVRKKDWKLCWPFASDDEKNQSKNQSVEQNSSLLPLTSQSFLQWSCQSCLREVGRRECGVETKSSDDCIAELPLKPDDQLARISQIVERTHSDARASTDTIIKNMHQDNKDENVAEACTNFKGPGSSSNDQAGHALPGINFAPPDINLNVTHEKPIYDITAKCGEMDGSSMVDLVKHTSGNHDGGDAELSIPLVHYIKSTQTGNIAENSNFGDELIRDSKRASVFSVLANVNDAPGNAVKDQTDRHVSRVFNERDRGCASSEGVEIIGNSLHATSSGLPRRKTRKVRLLTELLSNNGDSKTDQAASEASPSKAANGESAGTEIKDCIPQCQVSIPEIYREKMGDNKKRKLPHDEERRSTETISQVDLNKKVENSKKSEEIGRAMTGPELESVARNNWKNNRNDSIPIQEKKKSKKSQAVHARSYVLPLGDNFPNRVCEEVGFQGKNKAENGISFRPVNHVYPLTTSRKEKKSTLCKNKNKVPQVDHGQSSRHPWVDGFLQKSPSVWNDDIMQTEPMTVSFRQPDAATIDPGLQLSLGGYLAPGKGNMRYNSQFGDRISPLSWQESTRVDESLRRNFEKNHTAGSSPSKSDSYAILDKQGHGEFRGKFIPYNRSVFSANQKNKSPMEEDFRSLGKQVDNSGANNCQKPIKPKPLSAVPRKHGDKLATNMSDHGTSDDIPMEIVELMAQIQYERRQENPENSKVPYKTAEGQNNHRPDYEKAYCTERFICPEEASKRENFQASYGRKNAQPVKQKHADYFANGIHSDNGHWGQTQKKPSPSTSECSCAQNCKWNANIVGQGFFNVSSVQRGSCNACPTEEPPQHWPSRGSLPKPTRYNGVQHGPPQRPDMPMLPNAPMFLPKGDCEKIGSETFGRRNAENLFSNKRSAVKNQQNSRGSSDLYSNETIPAMHLLSLMDAGMPSDASFKRDPSYSNSKEYTQIPFGHSKSREAMKHPLDYHVKQPLPVKPHDFFPVNPMVNPSTSSFFHEKSFGMANNFTSKAPFGSRGKEKAQKRVHKTSFSQFPSGSFVPNRNPAALHSSVGFPLQPFVLEKSTELKLETPNHTGAFRPPKRKPDHLICSVNRNPADFSTPGAGNEYMIKGEDLKLKKQKKRRPLVTEVQGKRERNTKGTTEIVQARCPV